MRTLNHTFLVFIFVFLLSGCYMSKLPLSESPSSKIDTRLIKSWRSIPKNNKEKKILLVLWKFSEYEYLIAWKEQNDKILARGFMTKISDANIINLQDIKSLEQNERAYVFFKYNFNTKGNLVVSLLSEDYVNLKDKEFESSKEFREFVQKNLANDGLFDDRIEFEPTNKIGFEINP